MADHSKATTMPGEKILELLVPAELHQHNRCQCCNHRPQATLKDFYKKVLVNLLVEQELFSGKRPLGNSDWFEHALDTIPGDGSDDDKLNALIAAVDAL